MAGAGVMGRFHASAIAAAGGTLVAVVDPDLERARAVRPRVRAVASLTELADEGPIDVVHVCTPAATHASVVGTALELGANVIVEKPVAEHASATDTLLAAAASHGAMLVPVHQFLFQPGVERLLAARARLGTLVRVEFEAATAGADNGTLDADELVADILPHPLALFARLAPVLPSELEWLVRRPAAGELRAFADAGGTSFEIVVSTRGRPTRARLGVTGTTASAEVDLYHGFAVLEGGPATRTRKALRPFLRAASTLAGAGGNLAVRAARRESAYPGLRTLVRRTYEAISSGSPPPISAEETRAVAIARDALLGRP